MTRLFRRLALWTVLCVVSAAPSFAWAHHEYDRAAMVLGVALFIAAYTAATSTDAFERFHARPFVRRTLYLGYGLRVGLSVIFPVGMFADLYPGILSTSVVESTGLAPRGFAGTLATTIVQGTLLNVIIFAFMAVAYAFQRATMRPPHSAGTGFEVVLPASPPPARPVQ